MNRQIAHRGRTVQEAISTIPATTQQEAVNTAAIRKTIIRTEEGKFLISRDHMPFGPERKRMIDRHERVEALLQSATTDQLTKKVTTFLLGFSRLRALDDIQSAGLVGNFVEALEHMPIAAVAAACKAWNKRKFAWANYSHPPEPPELLRATKEMRLEMEVERYDLHVILLARPQQDDEEGSVSQEQRDECVATGNALIAELSGHLDVSGLSSSDHIRPLPAEIAEAREAAFREGVNELRRFDGNLALGDLMGRLDAKKRSGVQA